MKYSPVQKEALDKSADKSGFAYFMEMGLGKTLTDLSDTVEARARDLVDRQVVICPNSFKEGWVREVEKWGLPFSPHVFESGATHYNNRFMRAKHTGIPLLMVNYEAIRSASTREYIIDFIRGGAAKITADESIQIKTHDSAQTKAAIELAKQFQRRRILTGKPMTQGPHDIWAQMRFIGALDGFNYFAFRHRFCKLGGFKGKAVVGSKDEEGLAKLLDPWCFKAEKKDHMDLPKSYTMREYKLGPVLQKHYDDMLEEFIVWLNDEELVTVEAAITKYAKLMQIQCGFIIDESGKPRQLVSDDANPRLNALRSFLRDEASGKVCVPYHHIYSGDMLARALADLRPARIAGQNTMDALGTTIEQEKDRYNGDPSCRVILLQISASKYGHTLLGGTNDNTSHTMAFFENTYSLDARSQIEDRIHRMGQLADGCSYVDFVGTAMDRSVTDALQRKGDMYEAIMKHVNRRDASA